MARARKAPIPITITIVCGPRGAGKTTLINRLLADPAFRDTAVILNDFGETALSGGLVEKAEDGFIALGSGCVCCAVRGALTDGLEKLLRDLDNGRITAIGRVVIEADATADPAAIIAAVERHPYLALRFVADGIVAVLNAALAGAALEGQGETVRQVAMADVVAIVRPEADKALPQLIRSLNPTAVVADAAVVAPATLVGIGPFDPAIGDLETWLAPADVAASRPAPKGQAGRVRIFTVTRGRPIPFARLDRFVEYLTMLQGPNLIRVRGVAATGEGEAVVVDGLGGFFRPPLMFDRTIVPAVRFAVTAVDLDRAMFEGYLDAFLGEAAVDRPDATALTDNPLAIAGFSARSGR